MLDRVGLPAATPTLPERVFGRAAPARGHCPRAHDEPGDRHLRRADLGARRLGAGADPQPADGPAARFRPDLCVHQPQPRGRRAHRDPGRGDVPRPDRRDRRARALFERPRHPYTEALLASVLTPEPGLGIPDTGLGLAFPDPLDPPPGCPFHPRCPKPTCAAASRRRVHPGREGMVVCHLTIAGTRMPHEPRQSHRPRRSLFRPRCVQDDLARRVAIPTESQNPERAGELERYRRERCCRRSRRSASTAAI